MLGMCLKSTVVLSAIKLLLNHMPHNPCFCFTWLDSDGSERCLVARDPIKHTCADVGSMPFV